MIIAFILSVKLTAFCQVTETKEVKLTVLEAIAKDLEKCKLTEKTYQTTSFNFDALLKINIKIFNDLERQQAESKKLQDELKNINEQYNTLLKKKKKGWFIPALSGVVVGAITMGLVL